MRRYPATAFFDEDDLLPNASSSTNHLPSKPRVTFPSGRRFVKRPKAAWNRDQFVYDNSGYDDNGKSTMRLPHSADVEPYPIRPATGRSETAGPSSSRMTRSLSEDPRFNIQLSAWSKWSLARRASIVQKQESKESDTSLPPTIIKARLEASRLVSTQTLLQDMEAPGQKTKNFKPTRRGSKRFSKKLTVHQSNELHRYWDHVAFVVLRYIGLAVAIVNFLVQIVVLGVTGWSKHVYDNKNYMGGIWYNCELQSGACNFTMSRPESIDQNWQCTVAGLWLLSIFCGLAGLCFGIVGICSHRLSKLLYRLHSSAEIFIVTSVVCAAALIFYIFSVNNFLVYKVHQYGYAYILGWIVVVMYLLCAGMLLFDDIVRESARPCDCFGSARRKRKQRRLRRKQVIASQNSIAEA